MKKTFVVLAVVVSMVATMACGSAGKFKSEMDSLSYTIGANMGLQERDGLTLVHYWCKHGS